MIPTPPHLKATAAERDLGDCLRRYRRRPGAIGTFFAFAPLAGALALGIREGDTTGALAVVLFVWTPLFLCWCISTRRRLDGGLYVFDGGFADVHGRKVLFAITWPEVRSVEYETRSLWAGLIPVAATTNCVIELRNCHRIELNGSYRKLKRLAEDLYARTIY
ncbi:hypothetical protein DL990_08965 [Amycolatopsis sp. WAC 01416]|uniref:hypothetical protein n=1 Tax=Amycolatopsis sp. WAC 01416 TaxID=2203196 RepID=UPI000F7B4E4C|nr:hypothetical protein [Amycolatopsis sp. WAC 01416]RSN36245.1 hypothetical protein DL990_08965 [Amycolatopsis sp. WAC 01416]